MERVYDLKKDEIKRRQNMFGKRSCESLARKGAIYEIVFVLAKKWKPFSDGKEIIKLHPQIFVGYLDDTNIERKVDKIPLLKQTVTWLTQELSTHVLEQLKDLV